MNLLTFAFYFHLANVTCTDWSSTEDHVLLGCSDGSIVLYDSYRKITQSAKCALVIMSSSFRSYAFNHTYVMWLLFLVAVSSTDIYSIYSLCTFSLSPRFV